MTGASGFVGSRLITAACAAFGADNVIAVTSKSFSPCQSIKNDGVFFKTGEKERNLLATIEVLIHVGAFTPKDRSQANAIGSCNDNIRFTEELLSLPLTNLKKIIYISTSDVYQPAELINEDTTAEPISLYGWSKLYCEKMINVYAADRGLISHILRVGNVYGPGEEKYEKFLPAAIKNVLDGGKVEVWGKGETRRSLIYIDDVVASILQAINLQADVGLINVVGGSPMSVQDLIGELVLVSEKKVRITRIATNSPGKDCTFDNRKMRQYLLPNETEFRMGLRVEYAHMLGLQ